MLIKCKKSFRHQLNENSIYLVVEVLNRFTNNMISYRVIDNEGYPSIYEANRFEIVSNKINHFSILVNEECIILSHQLILNSELNKNHIEGFWGLFIEDDKDAKKVFQQVVSDLSFEEKIEPPVYMD